MGTTGTQSTRPKIKLTVQFDRWRHARHADFNRNGNDKGELTMPIRQDTCLGELTHFALLLPTDPVAYTRKQNALRDFLLDLADCARAASKVQVARKTALIQGIAAPERAAMTKGK